MRAVVFAWLALCLIPAAVEARDGDQCRQLWTENEPIEVSLSLESHLSAALTSAFNAAASEAGGGEMLQTLRNRHRRRPESMRSTLTRANRRLEMHLADLQKLSSPRISNLDLKIQTVRLHAYRDLVLAMLELLAICKSSEKFQGIEGYSIYQVTLLHRELLQRYQHVLLRYAKQLDLVHTLYREVYEQRRDIDIYQKALNFNYNPEAVATVRQRVNRLEQRLQARLDLDNAHDILQQAELLRDTDTVWLATSQVSLQTWAMLTLLTHGPEVIADLFPADQEIAIRRIVAGVHSRMQARTELSNPWRQAVVQYLANWGLIRHRHPYRMIGLVYAAGGNPSSLRILGQSLEESGSIPLYVQQDQLPIAWERVYVYGVPIISFEVEFHP